jgi:hypothetical protein
MKAQSHMELEALTAAGALAQGVAISQVWKNIVCLRLAAL